MEVRKFCSNFGLQILQPGQLSMGDVDMAAPVTPGHASEAGLGSMLEKEIDSGMEGSGAPKLEVKSEVKQEDVKMEASPKDDLGQLRDLEEALKAAGTDDFKTAFFLYGKALLEHCNGALTAITKIVPWEHADTFAAELKHYFPKSAAVQFFESQLPHNDSDEFNLHLSDLSWLPEASTKPAPYLHTCLQLWDEITTNGFITKGVLISNALF